MPVVLNENGPDGNISYLYGRAMISASSTAFQHYYQFDGLGSAINLTDATGNLRANYAYDPWGQLVNPLDPLGGRSKYKFTGEAIDPGTGMYYLRARYLDATIGRFIAPDPLTASLVLLPTMNRYQYASLNPTRFIDPSGLVPDDFHNYGSTTAFPTVSGIAMRLSNISYQPGQNVPVPLTSPAEKAEEILRGIAMPPLGVRQAVADTLYKIHPWLSASYQVFSYSATAAFTIVDRLNLRSFLQSVFLRP